MELSVRNGNAEAGVSILEAQQVPCLTLTLCDSTGLLVFYWFAPGTFSALGWYFGTVQRRTIKIKIRAKHGECINGGSPLLSALH